MSKQKQIVVAMVVLFVFFGIALTAKGQTPTSLEVARAAKSIKLDRRNSTTAERDGLKVTVTPANLANVKTAQFEKGYVIAVIDVTGGLDAGNGRHNLFVAKFRDGWRAFLESNGKVKELKNVQITETNGSERKTMPPQVIVVPPCWCVTQCWGSGLNGFCLMSRECHRCD